MPQLGAINYSPILQGSLAAAEGQMRGSEAVARGIQALGAGVGQGIERYQQNRQQTKQAEAVIKSAEQQTKALRSILPYLGGDVSQTLTPTIDSLQAQISDPTLSPIQRAEIAQQGISGFGQILNLGLAAQRAQEAAARPGRQAAALESAGVPASVVAAVRSGVPFEDAIKLAPARADKAVDPVSFRSQDAQGNPIEVTVDRITGRQISSGPVREAPKTILSPEEQARGAYLGERAKASAEFRSLIGNAARQGIESNDVLQRNIELLRSGDVKTGVGQEWIDTAKGAVNTILGTGAFDLSKQEEAKRNFSDFALAASARMQKQGQITESERRLLRDTVAQYANSVEGNIRVMQLMMAVNDRTGALNDYLVEIERSGRIPTEADSVEFFRANPLTAFERVGESVVPEPAQQRAAQAAGQDAEALSWLQSNPNHPRAADVRAKLVARGIIP